LATTTISFRFPRDHLIQRHLQRLRKRGQDVRAALSFACLDLGEIGLADSRRVRELRLGKYRVLYDVDEKIRIVSIEAIGLKLGNAFYFQGKEQEI
jgi:mRNA-degrading endonuclease RelE of RelBE toxin-antitoxin system